MRSDFLFRISAIVLAIFLQVAGLSTAGYAQAYYPPATALAEARGITSSSGIVISKRVDEVNLAFTVTDKKGRFISNLDANDFHVLDNHAPPQPLRFFQQQSDHPSRDHPYYRWYGHRQPHVHARRPRSRRTSRSSRVRA